MKNEPTTIMLSNTNIQPEEASASKTKRKRKKTKRAVERAPELCQGGKWTYEEHNRFLQALDLFGNIWKKVEDYIGTRSRAQIRSHAQKYFRGMRAKILAHLKKTGQIRKAIFIVTREYRNYTYCQPPTPGTVCKTSQTMSPSITPEKPGEEILENDESFDYYEEEVLSYPQEEEDEEPNESAPYMVPNAIPEGEYGEAQSNVQEEKKPFWVEENEKAYN